MLNPHGTSLYDIYHTVGGSWLGEVGFMLIPSFAYLIRHFCKTIHRTARKLKCVIRANVGAGNANVETITTVDLADLLLVRASVRHAKDLAAHGAARSKSQDRRFGRNGGHHAARVDFLELATRFLRIAKGLVLLHELLDFFADTTGIDEMVVAQERRPGFKVPVDGHGLGAAVRTHELQNETNDIETRVDVSLELSVLGVSAHELGSLDDGLVVVAVRDTETNQKTETRLQFADHGSIVEIGLLSGRFVEAELGGSAAGSRVRAGHDV